MTKLKSILYTLPLAATIGTSSGCANWTDYQREAWTNAEVDVHVGEYADDVRNRNFGELGDRVRESSITLPDVSQRSERQYRKAVGKQVYETRTGAESFYHDPKAPGLEGTIRETSDSVSELTESLTDSKIYNQTKSWIRNLFI